VIAKQFRNLEPIRRPAAAVASCNENLLVAAARARGNHRRLWGHDAERGLAPVKHRSLLPGRLVVPEEFRLSTQDYRMIDGFSLGVT
jgi:hypothetical protein